MKVQERCIRTHMSFGLSDISSFLHLYCEICTLETLFKHEIVLCGNNGASLNWLIE